MADPLATAGPTYSESYVNGPDSISFYTRSYTPTTTPTALIVFVHGFQEHIARYDHVFKRAQEQGFAVAAFDQRGWGRTVLNDDGTNKKGFAPWGWYGRTRRWLQLGDVEWFVGWAKEQLSVKDVPVFVWGQSMGGGLALSFGSAQPPGPPSPSTLAGLNGIVAASPLVQLSNPPAKPLRFVGGLMSKVVPSAPFPAEVPAADLSRDSRIEAAARADPLMKMYGTLGALNDMLSAGDYLHAKGFKEWPQDLPLLVVHGSGDKVCSYPASRAFYEQASAKDKKYISYEGAYHEIHNEPDGLWEKFVDDVLGWMKEHLGKPGETAKL